MTLFTEINGEQKYKFVWLISIKLNEYELNELCKTKKEFRSTFFN
jgi:hypothetical protein